MPAGIGGRDNRMNAEVGWGEDLSDLPEMGTEIREKPQQLICYRVRVRLDLEERNEGRQLDYLLLSLKRPVSSQEPHRWSCCLDKGMNGKGEDWKLRSVFIGDGGREEREAAACGLLLSWGGDWGIGIEES